MCDGLVDAAHAIDGDFLDEQFFGVTGDLGCRAFVAHFLGGGNRRVFHVQTVARANGVAADGVTRQQWATARRVRGKGVV